MANVNYLKKFNEYDEAKAPSSKITAEELRRAVSKNNQAQINRQNDIQAKKDKMLQDKINRLLPIIDAAERAVNARINLINHANVRVRNFKMFPSLSVDTLKNSVTTGVMTKMRFNRVENGQTTPSSLSLNIDVNRFLKYSASEAYTVLTSALYKSVMGKDMNKTLDLHRRGVDGLRRDARNKDNMDIKYRFEYNLAKYKVQNHVRKFLNHYENHVFNVTENEIVERIFQGSLTEKAILDIANGRFDLKILDEEIKSIGGIYNLPTVKEDKRPSKDVTWEKQEWLVLDREKLEKMYDPVVIRSNKRTELVNESLQESKSLIESFNSIKGMFTEYGVNKSPQNIKNLEAFCKNFSAAYMQAHGLSAVDIRFVNDDKNPSIGEYFDCGKSQYVEVNLAKITAERGIVDLTTTLAHELTHAVESTYNKEHGQYNKYGGGILDGTNTDISNSGLSGEAYKLLKDMNWKCYKADPCEQRARDGELIGLKFVEELTNGEYKKEIESYKTTNKEYQEKTDEIKENLASYIEECERKLSGMYIDKNTRGYAMIQEKLEYLKKQRDEYKELYGNKDAKDIVKSEDARNREDMNKELENNKEQLSDLNALMGL